MKLTNNKDPSIFFPAIQTPTPDTARHCPTCGALLNTGTQPSGAVPASYPGTAKAQLPTLVPLAAGTVLQGRYHIVRVLGTGAFGRVYLAQDMQDPSQPSVAIKELLDAQFSTADEKR